MNSLALSLLYLSLIRNKCLKKNQPLPRTKHYKIPTLTSFHAFIIRATGGISNSLSWRILRVFYVIKMEPLPPGCRKMFYCRKSRLEQKWNSISKMATAFDVDC